MSPDSWRKTHPLECTAATASNTANKIGNNLGEYEMLNLDSGYNLGLKLTRWYNVCELNST